MSERIPNRYSDPFERPMQDSINSKIFEYLVDFYQNLPQNHPSAHRAGQNLQRQFEKVGPRAKEQEMRYWNVLMNEFLNFLNRQDFMSKYSSQDHVAAFDDIVLKLKNKSVKLDPRFGYYFKKTLWESL